MSYRQLDNIDDKIILATLKKGSEMGAGRLCTKEIAKDCGISEFVIYDHFHTKAGLVSAVEKYVIDTLEQDNEKLIFENHLSATEYFEKMIEFYISHPEYTGWTINYGHIMPRTVAPEDIDDVSVRLQQLGKRYFQAFGYKFPNDASYGSFWSWVYAHFVNYAGMVYNKTMEDTKETRHNLIQIMVDGLNSFKA